MPRKRKSDSMKIDEILFGVKKSVKSTPKARKRKLSTELEIERLIDNILNLPHIEWRASHCVIVVEETHCSRCGWQAECVISGPLLIEYQVNNPTTKRSRGVFTPPKDLPRDVLVESHEVPYCVACFILEPNALPGVKPFTLQHEILFPTLDNTV